MNLKKFGMTLGTMWGAYALYKVITLILLYSFQGLEGKAYYEFIYFGIVITITFILLKLSKKLFHQTIRFKSKLVYIKRHWSIFIVPLFIYGVDAMATLPDIINHSIYIMIVSILSALGAAIFEEIRDRGVGLSGFSEALPANKWQPMLIALITSLSFSLTHYFNLMLPNAPSLDATNQQVVYTFFLGMVSMVLYMRTGSILYSILIHFLNNFSLWTPSADLSQAGSWSSMLILYALIPAIYVLWCLRPKKIKDNTILLNQSNRLER